MFRTSRILELAEFMLKSGYTARYPDRQLGFFPEKDGETLYLTQPINFQWLSETVSLDTPLRAIPEENCILCTATNRMILGADVAL